MKKHSIVIMTAAIIGIMLTSAPILRAATYKIDSPTIDTSSTIDIRTTTCMKTMEVLNETVPYREITRIETFGNGSRKAAVSLNFTFETGGICVSMDTIIPPASEPTGKRELASVNPTKPAYARQATGSPVWPWKYWYDALLSVQKGNDGYRIVSYDHDDNYDTYYPEQWYAAFSLDGLQKDHIHIPKNVMDDWYNGVIDRQTVVGIIMGIAGGVMAVITGVVALFYNPLAAILTIWAGIASIIGWLLALLGCTEANWIRDVVTEQYSGDGWTWTWGARMTDAFLWIFKPPIFDICYREDLYVLQRFQRVGIGIWEEMEYYQSWGADRDNPQRYVVEAWGKTWVNGGVFGTDDVYR